MSASISASGEVPPPRPFATPMHAYDTGYVLGLLMNAGLGVAPVVDDNRGYSPQIWLDDPRTSLRYLLTVEAT